MKSTLALGLILAVAGGCGGVDPPVRLTDEWPSRAGDYEDVTAAWTRKATLRSEYQEALELAATFKSPEWRAAHAAKDARARGLVGAALEQHMAQAQADAAGPYEFQVMVTTWDRRENDIDRGKKSVWKLRMLDEQGMEIEPLEIIKDKRPDFVVRNEFPAFGDFAKSYVVRFPREQPLLGPNTKRMRMRMSSSRGGVELVWSGG
ncbi:MAG: hypothetical protein M3680_11015 [Myxococcota bacterium]|nr:hypothetical protein [Myxococcota bacterium]